VPAGDTLDLLIRVGAYAATPLAALTAWGIAKYVRSLHLEKELADAQRQKADAEGRLAEATRSFDAAREAQLSRYDRVRAAFEEARDKFYRLRQAYLDLRDRGPVALPPGPGDADRITSLEAERDEARREVERLQQQVSDMTRFDGRLWLRPPTGTVPRFRPLADRNAVVISVLNLKGGVGKTTITANLAATLATADAPVLVIDLDYQRSLSMLLVGDKRRKELHGNQWSVQHFFRGPRHSLADLTGRLQELTPDLPHCTILTNSDAPAGGDAAESLEETENRLMVEWLVDRTRPDPRFYLREALHDPELHFKYVLLDCPPRLTTACVNALAASDFVLIPTVPDSISAHAVENLLYTLREFRDGLLPELAVAGIVPNMVKFRLGEPVEAHATALRDLRDALSGVWPEPVPIFKTGIRLDSAFGVSAAEMDTTGRLRLAVTDAAVAESFEALAKELDKETRRHASRRPAAVPAKLGARARSSR
jgi:chromosome partitioning protein